MYDVRFKKDFTYVVVGPSRCGKTVHVKNILENQNILFQSGKIQNVHYFYREWQSLFDRMKDIGIVKQWHNNLPTTEIMRELAFPHIGKDGTLFIIDDFGQNLTGDISDLFNVLSHHANISVIILLQTLFSKNPVYREIQLSAQYLSLFKNNRDKSQILQLARQINPSNKRFIVESFHEATKAPYTYLMFDLSQDVNERVRIKSNFLPQEKPVIAWMEKKMSI